MRPKGSHKNNTVNMVEIRKEVLMSVLQTILIREVNTIWKILHQKENSKYWN